MQCQTGFHSHFYCPDNGTGNGHSGTRVPVDTFSQDPSYLTDICPPCLSVRSTCHFRSAEQGLLHASFARTSTMQSRVFSVVGLSVWNGLPLALRSFPRVFS